MEEGLFQEHDKAYEYLEKLGIYELRLYGRELGVQRPTGMKKKDLIEEIIKIGSSQKQIEGKSRRGAHPKSRIVSEKEFEKLNHLFQPTALPNEIEIKLSKDELDRLVQFVFLGNFIINGIRLPQDCLREYEDLTNKMYEIKTKLEEHKSDKNENEFADLQDRIYDSVCEYLEAYEQDVYLEKLAKRVTDINYPLNGYDEEALFINFRAGADVATYIKKQPQMTFFGHFNKMCMKFGEDAMREEFERLLPSCRAGKFIPAVDHQTPPDVSIENYKTYVRLLHEYAEKVSR